MTSSTDLRRLSFAIAYRMLGSVAEAEDVVQEALLRLHEAADVDNDEAYVTTVTTRLAIDVLRSARVRRESYVGEWLPEPLVEPDDQDRVEREEDVSLAFLVLLERLTPDERAVLVLREAFDVPFGEIAATLDKSEPAVRQILSRARRHVDEDRPRFEPDPDERRALAARFLEAASGGDMDGLVALLAPDAVLVGDGGGKAYALPRPMVGGDKIAHAIRAFYVRGQRLGVSQEPVWINGQPGFRWADPDGRIINIMALDVVDGRIARLHSILNPDKLGHLGATSELGLRSPAT